MKKKKNPPSISDSILDNSNEPFTLSIGHLMGKEDRVSAVDSLSEQNTPPLPETHQKPASYSKIVLQRERAGRGGKTVTHVSVSPPLSPNGLESLNKTLRKSLGCGSHIEDSRIVLQGDIAERVREWFSKQGVRHIVGPG